MLAIEFDRRKSSSQSKACFSAPTCCSYNREKHKSPLQLVWHPSPTTLSMIIYHQYLRQSDFTRYLVHYHIMPRPPPVVGTISGEKTNTGNQHHIPNNIINDNQYLHQGPRQIFSPSSLFVHSLERRPTGRTRNF